MKVHTVIARALAERGVTHVFGLLGDGNLFVVDDLVREWGITYVAANREDGAVLMADAYARTGDRLAVATVTHGPGLTNTVTALHEAARNRTPLIVLCGDTAPEDRAHNQDIDQRATVLPTGAAFYQLRGAVTAVEDVAIAVRQATVERRPVVLNLPVEIQTREAIYEPVRWEAPPIQAVAADPEVIDRAVGLIATARRPVVLAGSGAVQAGARGALLRLAEALRAPVATTLKASGLFRGQPFDLGLFGTLSSQPAVQAISQADCIVAFGAGLNRYTTSFRSTSTAAVSATGGPSTWGWWEMREPWPTRWWTGWLSSP
jgi:thiamine pyrophosphate-dependent acetolactate synthase large subunit-like protein